METWLPTLRRAVTLAKDRHIQSVRNLRSALEAEGHTSADITAALKAWQGYERDKQTGCPLMA